jgi:uncharacterized protein (DUF1800 family)
LVSQGVNRPKPSGARGSWLLPAVAFALLLAACSGGDSPTPVGGTNPPPPAPEPVPIPSPEPTPPPPTPLPTPTPISRADAARFLEQATFGPTETSIARVQAGGFGAYLDEQFAAASSGYSGFTYVPHTRPADCSYDSTAPTGPASICARDNYSLFQVQRRFFQHALAGSDQLRQRVAFALAQIFVVSGTDIYEAYGMAAYQTMLLRNAFGNFRDLLTDVTLSPVMGNYLDMVKNDKPNPARGTTPNENYARELLQLFSIGIHKLNLDGTVQVDGQARPLPAYDEDIIEGYAYLFTGWTYPPRPGATSRWTNPINYEGNMVAFADHHDTSAKPVLDGRVIPAGQSPQQDLADGLDVVFDHPNVGPFIGKQLIQHLVTSNPTPQYVARVAAAFNNNGQGVRGDLRAVVRAILLDPEARGDAKTEPRYGHLREPALFLTSMLRAVGGQSDGVYLRAQSSAMGQNVFTPPSVFNFYPPDQEIPGSGALGPEFGIQDATTAINRANFVYQMVYGNGAAPNATVVGSTGTTLDLAPYQASAADAYALVELLNQRLMHGALSASAAATIAQAVDVLPTSDAVNRVRMAVYLLASSQQYQVER